MLLFIEKKRREKEDPVLTTCYVIILMYVCVFMILFPFLMLRFNESKTERQSNYSTDNLLCYYFDVMLLFNEKKKTKERRSSADHVLCYYFNA